MNYMVKFAYILKKSILKDFFTEPYLAMPYLWILEIFSFSHCTWKQELVLYL